MKSWRIEEWNELALHESDDPIAPPGHVVVRLRAASLNYRDILTLRGVYNPKQPLPLIPCSDGAGDVVSVGDGVALQVGARVATLFSQGWQGGPATMQKIKRSLGGPLPGTLATHIVLPESGVASFPDAWSYEEASTLPCAALTAWSGLVEHHGLRAGQRVLILGTGGVSTFALQIAKLHNARAVVVTGKPDLAKGKLASVFDIVDSCIDRNSHGDWEKEVRKVWPEGADVVVEVGGAGTLTRSIRATAVGGTVLVIGVLAGGVDTVNLVPVLMQNIRLQGIIVGHRDGFTAMTRAFNAATSLRPVIDSVFHFVDAPKAFAHMASGAHVGKVVVRVN